MLGFQKCWQLCVLKCLHLVIANNSKWNREQGPGVPVRADENTGHPVQLEFLINSQFPFHIGSPRICLYQKFFIIYQIFNSSLVFIWQPNRVSTTQVSIRNQLNSPWILKASSDSWRILGALTLEGFAVSGGPFAQTSHTKARVRVAGQSQPLGANLAERLGNQPQCCSLWGKSKFSVEQKMVAQEQL